MTLPIKSWYAVYTKSRAEKKVALELDYKEIECYLPLQKKLRQWSDRKKWIETPLISGYIFVFISPKEYDKVLQTNGIVSYVRFEGKAAIIPDNQITAIKQVLQQTELSIDIVTRNFSAGDEIEVLDGPVMGLKGKLISIKGKKKVAVELQQLNLTLTIDLSNTKIKKITSLEE
jgi:transcription antitermination factor NusG